MRPLEGKRALVTGAASGIGRASAIALAEAGARVIGLDLKASTGDISILSCDLASEKSINDAVRNATVGKGAFDILVNNAGIYRECELGNIASSHIDQMFAVNVRGTILVTRELLPHLSEAGRIINITSELAALGRAGASVYVATKAALVGLTRSWARELSPRLLVNAVAPGPTDTPLLSFQNLTPEQKVLETNNPMGRIARPEEVAAAVVFLAGPGASFFTGQCLGANGGAAMY